MSSKNRSKVPDQLGGNVRCLRSHPDPMASAVTAVLTRLDVLEARLGALNHRVAALEASWEIAAETPAVPRDPRAAECHQKYCRGAE